MNVRLLTALNPHSCDGVPGPPVMIRDVMVIDGAGGGGGGSGASTNDSVFVPLTNVPARASRYPVAVAPKFMLAIVNESNR